MHIWDQAALAAAENAIGVEIFITADGTITPEEEKLRAQARLVSALAEETAKRQKLARRVGSGGNIDHNLRAEMNAVDNVLRQAAIPATASGSGSHGGKGNGLTFTRKANGSTRLVRRG